MAETDSQAEDPPERRARMSIARRLLLGALIWSLVVLVGGVLALTAAYRAQSLELLQEELDSTLVTLTRALEVLPDGRVVDMEDKLPNDERFTTPLSGRYWAMIAVNEAGDFVNDIRPDSLWEAEPPIPQGLAEEALANRGTTYYGNAEGPAGETVRTAIRSITIPNRETPILIMAAADREDTDEGVDGLRLLMLTAMGALAGGTLLAMWIAMRVVLRPFDHVQSDIADVRAGRRAKLRGGYPEEVQPLAEELNKLLEHNRQVVDRARTHVGNLAHALKTPLAVLRNEARGDTALDQTVRRQSEAMRTNVDHYLKRAQAAARAEALSARSEVKPVADGLTRLLSRLFADHGITVTNRVPDGTHVRCETQDLEEMLGNLMENACKWANGRVEVSAVPGEKGQMLIHIDDDGPGLTAEEAGTALKRGVRLDESAPGSGLGLSIVNELAEMNGGGLSLTRSPVGGLRASLAMRAG